MTNPERQQLNYHVIDEFRSHTGIVGGQFAGIPLILLTTTGAHSGRIHTWPLAYLPDDGRFVVFAANGGRPNRPGWYHNLRARPDAVVEVGDAGDIRTVPVWAHIASGAERERLWAAQLAVSPFLADFQARVPWQIPVVVLSPNS